jgi:hypothetical protein
MIRMRVLMILALFLTIAGCGTIPSAKTVPLAAPQDIGHAPLKSLQVSKVMYDIPKGTQTGTFSTGWMCLAPRPIVVESEITPRYNAGLTDLLRLELKKAGYPIVQSENKLFLDDAAIPAELVIGAMIKELMANQCAIYGIGAASARGNIYMKIEWQVFGSREQKVVYTATTEGSY